MFCHNCGKELPGGVRFCPHCGAPQRSMSGGEQPDLNRTPAGAAAKPDLSKTPARPGGGQPSPGFMGTQANTAPFAPAQPPKTPVPKKKTGLLAAIAGILVLAVVLAVLLAKGCGQKEEAAAASEAAPAENTQPEEQTEDDRTQPAETEAPEAGIAWYDFETVNTDSNGYTIQQRLHISQWISYTNDFDTLQEAWSTVGKDRQLPSTGTMGIGSNYINNGQYTSFIQYDEVFYAVGTLEAYNKTEGYDITESDTYTTYFSLGIGSVNSSLLVMYSNEHELFGLDRGGDRFETGAGYGISGKMKSNHWGTVPIVICYLVDKTPNEPEGKPAPGDLLVWFHSKNDHSFTLEGIGGETETEEWTEEAMTEQETEPEAATEKAGQIGTTEQPAAGIAGTWKGSYSPSQGKTGCTLDIYEENGRLRGIFEFYNLKGKSNSKEGSFAFTVEDLGGGEYLLREDQWIDRPGNYNMVSWYVTLEGDSLRGSSKADGSGIAIEVTRQ